MELLLPDLYSHFKCILCDSFHLHKNLTVNKTFQNGLITPFEIAARFKGDLEEQTQSRLWGKRNPNLDDNNEDKKDCIYRCPFKCLVTYYAVYASSVGLVSAPFCVQDLLTHTIPFALIDHLAALRRVGKSTSNLNLFPRSSTLYYSHKYGAVWEEHNDEAEMRMTLNVSGCWAKHGLLVHCALRFLQLQASSGDCLGDGKGLLICPHVSTSSQGILKRSTHKATHEECHLATIQLRRTVLYASRLTSNRSPASATCSSYQAPLYHCSKCPTDFQVSVNDRAELTVDIWRYLGHNMATALKLGTGTKFCSFRREMSEVGYDRYWPEWQDDAEWMSEVMPDEYRRYSDRPLKDGGVKEYYERCSEDPSCSL